MTKTLAALALLATVAACGTSGSDEPARATHTETVTAQPATVRPGSKADIDSATKILCAEPTQKIALLLLGVQQDSQTRLTKLLVDMRVTCPAVFAAVKDYVEG